MLYEQDQIMRILALHGYLQSGAVIRKKLEAWRLSPTTIEWLCPDGPQSVETIEADGEKKNGYGWWRVDLRGALGNHPDEKDLELCVQTGQRTMQGDPHCDLAIAFSQGCACLMYWISLGVVVSKRIILIAGFRPRSLIPDGCRFDIPVLLVRGEKDTLLDEVERSLAGEPGWSNLLDEKTVHLWSHRWGHVIPSDRVFRERVATFLQS